ncbi:myo-inositol 2-dehydrogenase / D-chiro-inositol 1-dehydrogenase [Roseivivax marinus]|jgi:myo-inositol 2-dehydrogenase/D-chiro-inositol 1-dehydrogenase|uniref:Gfo/Idh/MocA family protein n=1 Tax=Roseivivax marinus TaxID=1379903 RepID=UPI0008C5E339|nr:Gfo/Idh/MocA family oxidoreductase [Roseivivax marinus]SEL75946.1 myo-inositol 2-dehydrogenase / D-chiro-inositol 1-dehydrogenase [Roseivivax marinus]
MIRMGWIGCGRHARQMLLPQLGRNDIRIAALCDRDGAALSRTAEEYGVTACYDDFREMIAAGGIDAVGMAVGPDLHRAAAIAALEAGLPVFMEKPPAADAAGAREVAEAARRAGKPVMVGFMKRYSTGNRIAMNTLRDGDFGDVLGITGAYMTAPTYFEGEPDYTGFYLHHCVHYMDLIPWFAGEDFGDMQIRSASPAPGKLLLHLNFTTEGGVIGNVVMGTVQSRGTPMEEIRIMGDHARLHVDNIIDVSLYRDPPFKADDPEARLDPAFDTLSWRPNFTAAANEDHKGYAALLSDVAAVLRGDTRAVPDIEDGVRAMERLERMIAQIDA